MNTTDQKFGASKLFAFLAWMHQIIQKYSRDNYNVMKD